MAAAQPELQPGLGVKVPAGAQPAPALSWRRLTPPGNHHCAKQLKHPLKLTEVILTKKPTTFTEISFITTADTGILVK